MQCTLKTLHKLQNFRASSTFVFCRVETMFICLSTRSNLSFAVFKSCLFVFLCIQISVRRFTALKILKIKMILIEYDKKSMYIWQNQSQMSAIRVCSNCNDECGLCGSSSHVNHRLLVCRDCQRRQGNKCVACGQTRRGAADGKACDSCYRKVGQNCCLMCGKHV